MQLETWAKNIQRDVYKFWKENHQNHDGGFRTFYTPVQENPLILFIGFNPGGDPSSFKNDLERFEEDDFSLPKTHEYLSASYPLARRMREKLFKDNQELLKNSAH
jgi:hypothetical protein